MITTKSHGIIDYLMGATLIILAVTLPFEVKQASVIMLALGVGTLGYSLLTNYELGALKWIPFKIHLIIDILGGVVLVLAPFWFGLAVELAWLFILLGVAEITISFLTLPKQNI